MPQYSMSWNGSRRAILCPVFKQARIVLVPPQTLEPGLAEQGLGPDAEDAAQAVGDKGDAPVLVGLPVPVRGQPGQAQELFFHRRRLVRPTGGGRDDLSEACFQKSKGMFGNDSRYFLFLTSFFLFPSLGLVSIVSY